MWIYKLRITWLLLEVVYRILLCCIRLITLAQLPSVLAQSPPDQSAPFISHNAFNAYKIGLLQSRHLDVVDIQKIKVFQSSSN